MLVKDLLEKLKDSPKDVEVVVSIEDWEIPVKDAKYYPESRTPFSVGGWIFTECFILYV